METVDYTNSLAFTNHKEANFVIPVLSHSIGSWRFSVAREPLNREELADRYDREAVHWRRKLERFGMPQSYRDLVRRLAVYLPQLKKANQQRVLDCGVGTGAFSVALANQQSTRFELDAVDVSPAMLNQAASTFKQAGLKARLHLADISNLPFEDNTFDLALAVHVVEHVTNPIEAITELKRVLKPGGRVVLCCTRRTWRGAAIQFKWRTHTVSATQLEQWLRFCGFGQVQRLDAGNRSLFDRMSVACTAKKSVAAGEHKF